MSAERQVIVVGAGPAGLAAALRAAEGGAEVTVIDEAPLPGGQIYRQPPPGFQKTAPSRDKDALRGEALLRRFAEARGKLDFSGNTTVLGWFPENRLLLEQEGHVFEMRGEALVLATGAYERSIPFLGWTLPGVYTLGGCQVMLKSQHVLPGRRILVAGSGPLLLVLSRQLLRAGAEVVAVLEAASYANLALAPHRLWGHWELLGEGLACLRELKRAGIPVLQRHGIVEAHGKQSLSEVVISPLNRNWQALPQGRQRVSLDAVAVGFGFVPNTELSRMAGCAHRFDEAQGGWVPLRDRWLQTSLPGLYCAGDGAGVMGAQTAELEGELVGMGVLRQLGQKPDWGQALRLRARLRKLARFRRALARLSAIRPGILSLCTPETIICRCEDISLAAIQKALTQGGPSLDGIKRLTRAGMGICQGRTCLPHVAALAAQAGGGDEARTGWHRPRPPLRPLPISELAAPSETKP